MKKLALLCYLSFVIFMANAQQVPELPDKKATIKSSEKTTGSTEHPISIQLHGGTQGLGLDARYGVTKNLSVRLGGSSMIPVTVNNAFDFSGFNSDNSVKGELANVHLLADYSPFKSSVFKFVAGAGYLFKANGKLRFTPTGTYNFGGLNLTSQEVGDLDIDFSWKGFAPYAGIGLFKTFPKRRFNVNLDLGSYFLKAPKSTVVGTKLLADNNTLEPQFDANMSSYRFLPVVQLNFNFRIN